jgi:hypothetical protein
MKVLVLVKRVIDFNVKVGAPRAIDHQFLGSLRDV